MAAIQEEGVLLEVRLDPSGSVWWRSEPSRLFFSPALDLFLKPPRFLVSFSSPSASLGLCIGTLFGSVQPVLVLVGLLFFFGFFPLFFFPFPLAVLL